MRGIVLRECLRCHGDGRHRDHNGTITTQPCRDCNGTGSIPVTGHRR